MAILSDFTDVTYFGIDSTSNFLGQARFFNSALFARPTWDFAIGGGDVGFELLHMFDHSINGGRVDGGTLQLINHSSWIVDDPTTPFPVYQIYFGTNAGSAGKISEVIGGSCTSGIRINNPNPANVVQAWINFDFTPNPASTIPRELTSPLLLAFPGSTANPLTLAWPGDVGYFGLFQTADLSPPAAWIPITNTPFYSNNQWTLTLPVTDPPSFYRLRAP
jgi:hypothetical protein